MELRFSSHAASHERTDPEILIAVAWESPSTYGSWDDRCLGHEAMVNLSLFSPIRKSTLKQKHLVQN